MADIFEEVEEGLRQEKAARLWKKYGVFAYIAAALLIGGVALNEYMQSQRSQNLEEQSMAFESADQSLSSGTFDAAADEFDTLARSDSEIAPLAANFLAQTRLAGNADTEAAIAALEMAANAETPIGKLSLMKAAYLKSETASRAELETYLGSLLDEESQFGALALELVAAKAAQEGDTEYARQVFNELRFLANVPDGVTQRSVRALAALPPAPATGAEAGTDASEDGAVMPEETTGESAQTEEIPDSGVAGSSDGDQPE